MAVSLVSTLSLDILSGNQYSLNTPRRTSLNCGSNADSHVFQENLEYSFEEASTRFQQSQHLIDSGASTNNNNTGIANSQTHSIFNHSFDSLLSAKDFEFHPIHSAVLAGTHHSEEMGHRKRRAADWSDIDLTDSSDESPSPKVPMLDNDRGASISSICKRKGQPGRISWPDDIDLDLQAEISNSIYNSDSLFNFTGLTVFKRESSPQNPNEPYAAASDNNNHQNYSPRDDGSTGNRQQLPQQNQAGNSFSQGNNLNGENMNQNGNYGSPNEYDNNGSPAQPPTDHGFLVSHHNEPTQFQYILKAATAIGQKHNEDSLTYLNQGQSYEVRLKKLGDLSGYRGKLLKSVIKICFHERRLQYMEKEQMRQWQDARPGERILELDIPLSYGVVHYNQPTGYNCSNLIEIMWDPFQDCGVYIRVNCISTEFTPKKHGGEKGVPFRIQVETFEDTIYGQNKLMKPLHAAACQIKVFKLKGADRKHKQDREKILKRPPSEQEKYQRSYEYTILNDISLEHLYSIIPTCYSPEQIKRNGSPVNSVAESPNQVFPKYDAMIPYTNNNALVRTESMTSTNGLLKSDENELNRMDYEEYVAPLSAEFSPSQVSHWLAQQRLSKFTAAFSHFSGVDLLRMTKEDLVQICGLADGIRMYNVIHHKSISPRLTIYITLDNAVYHAIYLHSNTVKELLQKLHKVPGFVEPPTSPWNLQSKYSGSNSSLAETVKSCIFIIGPANVQVMLTDEVLNNIKNDTLFGIETQNGKVIMRPEIIVNN